MAIDDPLTHLDPELADGVRAARVRARENARHIPPLTRALRGDAVRFAAHRSEPHEFRNVWGEWWNAFRLLFASDDYAGVALWRIRVALRRAHIPVLPWIINRVCITFWGIRIGDHVIIAEGLYLPHGNVVLDGISTIGKNAVIAPWVTVGVRQGDFTGPTIGANVFLGTHASVLGDVTVGDGASVGGNSVVTRDVAPGATVAGVPARPIASADAGVPERPLPADDSSVD
jgi:serine acetyltransferase